MAPADTPRSEAVSATVLALHHDYRIRGGEEAAAQALADVAESELGERVAWLRRSSGTLSGGAAARGLVRGGTDPRQVSAALRGTGADLLHAHNLFPTLGPRAVQAAADAGAATVVHLHNSRLVCAVAVNVRDGAPCEECRAGFPLPGIRHRCRGGLPEALAYGASLSRWRRGLLAAADVVIVPSSSAKERLLAMGVALPGDATHVVGGVAVQVAEHSRASQGRYALITCRLAPEKDLITAISATAGLGMPLVIAGEGPERDRLERLAQEHGRAHIDPAVLLAGIVDPLPKYATGAGHVVFTGHLGRTALAQLRAGARIGLVPSLAPETFGLAALESMAAALPTLGSAVGALPELLGVSEVVAPGDPTAMASAIHTRAGNDGLGEAAARRAAELAGPAAVGRRLASAYAQARERRDARLRS